MAEQPPELCEDLLPGRTLQVTTVFSFVYMVDVVEKLFTTRGRTLCSHNVLCEVLSDSAAPRPTTPSHRTL